MSKSEEPLNFETEDFSDKDFLDYIEEPIGKKIRYFSALISRKNETEEPLMFWLNVGEKKWYRFFIDAWLTHWDEYNEMEKEELIEEDFEEDDEYFVRNLVEELSIEDKKIKKIEVSRLHIDQLFTSQVKISIEDNKLIIVRDYGDEKPSELLVCPSTI